MCRFAGYIGDDYMILSDLLNKSSSSLINQSYDAKESAKPINGDGFGIAWYNHNVDDKPATYKSINPAWNDYNLLNIISKVRAKCFIGHVRASTVGNVNLNNCHPFTYKDIVLTHNGTIYGFNSIRKDVLSLLDNEIINNIKGNTDSEHFFGLMLQNLKNARVEDVNKATTDQICKAITNSINTIVKLQKRISSDLVSYINLIVTNGKMFVSCRYSNDPDKSMSFYYSRQKNSTIIASEPLNPAYAWVDLPVNHFLVIKGNSQEPVTKAIVIDS